jgi:iron complex outermembrane receptor protein
MTSEQQVLMIRKPVPIKFWACLLYFGISLLANDSCFAQENKDSLRVELDPIEVTAIHSSINAADAPLALSTLSRDLSTINQNASLSLQSISQGMPGLWINDRQNHALGERLTIRGVGWRAAFGVRGVQVVLNDIPLTVADGQTMINIVEPAFIRRAELVRGPAASFWGNSSGGVLYLSTESSYTEEKYFRLRTLAGSYGMRKAEGEFSISNSSHQMNGYTSYQSTDGYRDYSAAQVLRSGITGSVSLSSESRLKYQAASIYMPQAQHPSSLTASEAENNPTKASSSFINAEAGKEITQAQGGLSYIHETPIGMLDITGYGIYRDLNNPLPFGIIIVNRGVGGIRATLDKSWGDLELQAGIESKLQNDDRTEFENIGDGQRGDIKVDQIERVWNQAIFATGTYSTGNLNILGGLRYDQLTFRTDAPVDSLSGSRTFQSLSPSIGINYQPSNQTIYTNLSTSFEAPTTTELVNRPGGGNGFNPDLKPEQTIGLEAGIRGSNTSKMFNYDLTAYRLWIQDLLFPYLLQSDGPTYYRNQGETQHTGIEGHFSWIMNRDWKISATANITEAEFKRATVDTTSLSGKEVPGIPKYRINGHLGWTPGNFSGTVSYEFISSYTVNNLNTEKNDKYGIFDIKFSYRKTFQNTSVKLYPFLNVNNVLDKRYNGSIVVNANGNFFEPAPGRNWQLGISVEF